MLLLPLQAADAAEYRDPLRAELNAAAAHLDAAARVAMGALLLGPTFDSRIFKPPGGPLLQWVERLLTYAGGAQSLSTTSTAPGVFLVCFGQRMACC